MKAYLGIDTYGMIYIGEDIAFQRNVFSIMHSPSGWMAE